MFKSNDLIKFNLNLIILNENILKLKRSWIKSLIHKLDHFLVFENPCFSLYVAIEFQVVQYVMSGFQKLINVKVLIFQKLRLASSFEILSPCIFKILLRYLAFMLPALVPYSFAFISIHTWLIFNGLSGSHKNELNRLEVLMNFNM